MKTTPPNLTDYVADDQVRQELEAYMNATTDQEKRRILETQREAAAGLSKKKKKNYEDRWMEGMNQALEGSRQELEDYRSRLTKDKLGKAPQAISLSYIAKNYFGKSKEWLYQRINGNIVNGKPAHFTEEETRQLQNALHDLGAQLLKIKLL